MRPDDIVRSHVMNLGVSDKNVSHFVSESWVHERCTVWYYTRFQCRIAKKIETTKKIIKTNSKKDLRKTNAYHKYWAYISRNDPIRGKKISFRTVLFFCVHRSQCHPREVVQTRAQLSSVVGSLGRRAPFWNLLHEVMSDWNFLLICSAIASSIDSFSLVHNGILSWWYGLGKNERLPPLARKSKCPDFTFSSAHVFQEGSFRIVVWFIFVITDSELRQFYVRIQNVLVFF